VSYAELLHKPLQLLLLAAVSAQYTASVKLACQDVRAHTFTRGTISLKASAAAAAGELDADSAAPLLPLLAYLCSSSKHDVYTT
jgi:hypothetical protein